MPSFYEPTTLSAEERLNHAKRFLSAYGKDHDVHFEFDGQPQTDGKIVWLGSLDPNNPTFITRALAHGMHEMLHVTDTDLTQYQKGAKSALAAELMNVLEDVRIDTLGMQRYPGYRVWRNELADLLASEGCLRAAYGAKDLSIPDLVSTWLHAELLAPLNVGWAQRYHLPLRSAVLNNLSSEIVERLLVAAKAIEKAQSTEDVARLTEKLLQILLKEKITSNADDELDLFSDVDQFDKDRSLEALQNAARSPVSKEKLHPLVDVRKAQATAFSEKKPFAPKLWPENTTDRQLLEDAELYSEKFRNENSNLQALTKRFKRVLRGPAAQSYAKRTGPQLTPDFAIRVGLRDERLFLNERTAKVPNAEVVLLLDRSGSMGVDRMTKAKIALASLVKALSPIRGIETTCALFPGPCRAPLALAKTRKETEDVFLRRFAGIGAFGATPFAEAMIWAIDTLKKSPHKKKLLIVITDGLFQEENAAALREALEKNFIEMALLNIDTENPAICENTVNVAESDKIGAALIELIEGTSFAKENGRA